MPVQTSLASGARALTDALLAGLEPRTLDDLDLRACGSSHLCEVDRATVRERQRPRFGQYRHTFGPQVVDGLRQRTRGHQPM